MPLFRFIARRLSNALFIALLTPLLTLLLLGGAPGDYLSELASDAQVSHNTLAQMRLHYGLDRPLPWKYSYWVRSAISGDLGFSFVYQRPIRELIAGRVWNTVLLNAMALVVAWTLGLALSLLAAMPTIPAMRWLDRLNVTLATVLLSTPAVLLALLLLAATIPLGLPVGGMTSRDSETLTLAARAWDLLRHLLLPVCAVSAVWLPVVMRHTRAALDGVLREPYIVTARAKGLSRTRVLLHHAFRNALNPLTTLFGLSVSALLSASLPVEVVMGWPGIGSLTYEAVLKRDIFLVMDLAVISALLLLCGNLLGDLLLYASDPRVKERA